MGTPSVLAHPSVIRSAAGRVSVPRSQSLGASAAAASGRLRARQREAVRGGGTPIGGQVLVVAGFVGTTLVAKGASVRSVHRYRKVLDGKPGRGGNVTGKRIDKIA